MTPHQTLFRVIGAVAFVAALLALPGCGSDDNTTTTSGPVSIFTPDTAAPAPLTLALLSGASTGASIDVRVTVTGVTSFFGAAFRIKYDNTALLFNGMTSSGSLLRDGVAEGNLLFSEDHSSVPGEVLITATRLDPTTAPPVDVTTTADLVVLNFTARKVILPATAEGRVEFGDPKQVCDGTVNGSGCGEIAVTWSGGGVSAQ